MILFGLRIERYKPPMPSMQRAGGGATDEVPF